MHGTVLFHCQESQWYWRDSINQWLWKNTEIGALVMNPQSRTETHRRDGWHLGFLISSATKRCPKHSPVLCTYRRWLLLQDWAGASLLKLLFFPLEILWQMLSLGLEKIPPDPLHHVFSNSTIKIVVVGFLCMQHTARPFKEQNTDSSRLQHKSSWQTVTALLCSSMSPTSNLLCLQGVTLPLRSTWSSNLSTSRTKPTPYCLRASCLPRKHKLSFAEVSDSLRLKELHLTFRW